MDRPRIREQFVSKHKKLLLVAGGFLLLSGAAIGIARLEPGAPTSRARRRPRAARTRAWTRTALTDFPVEGRTLVYWPFSTETPTPVCWPFRTKGPV